MGRGFLSGIFWGGIVGMALLFVSSQTLERRSLSFPEPEAVAVEVPGGSEFNQAREETDPVVPEPDARPEGDSVAGVAMPEESGDEPPVLDTAALEVPVPSTTQEAPSGLGDAPDESADVSGPTSSQDSAVEESAGETLAEPENPGAAPDTETTDLEAPAATVDGDDAPVVESDADSALTSNDAEIAAAPSVEAAPTEPEANAAPRVASQISGSSGLTAPSSETTSSGSVGGADLAVGQAPDAPELPSLSSEPSLPPVGVDTEAAPEVAVAEPEEAPLPKFMVDLAEARAAEAANATDTGQEAVDADAPEPAPIIDREPAPAIAGAANDEDEDGDQEVATADTEGSSVLQPVRRLTDQDSNLVTGRSEGAGNGSSLPVVRRLGDSSAAEEQPEEELALLDAPDASDAEGENDADVTSLPALRAYARDFEAPAGMPLMSIVLVQQGGTALPAAVLDALSPNVAFAIDASQPDAAAIARTYRDADREVVMIPALPQGAAPQDIEQALRVNFERVPEAVAVMDVSGSSFQSDRAAVAQVVEVVSASGHGIITFPRGLNTAHQQAERAGVPTGLIFRNLDGGGETQEQIRRTLDRAAFRARQDEAVILVGTTGANTLSALTEWALGNRAASVAIAPVSMALGG